MTEPARPRRRPGRPPGSSQAREKILRAAVVEFSRDGYHSVSMRQIAASADVDVALIYHYFASKTELFAQTIPTLYTPSTGRDWVVNAPPADRARAIVETFVDQWEADAAGTSALK